MKRQNSELLQVWISDEIAKELAAVKEAEECNSRADIVRRILREGLRRRADAVRKQLSRQRRKLAVGM